MTCLAVLALVLAAMSAVMLAAWLHQKRVRDAGVVDIYWTFGTGISGMACALLPFDGPPDARQWLVAALVGLWSLRLGGYITVRVVGARREDARYARLRRDWGADFEARLLWFLQIQAPVTALLCLSLLAAAHNPAPLGPADLAAVAIWAVAIGGESLADRQMRRFRADPANHGGICEDGLWAWSRHPNYFFEWLGWCAYAAMALTAPHGWLGLAAPLVMFLVLRFGSGVPPLEQSMQASRGAAWEAYARRVPAFFPRPPSGK